MIRRDSKYVLNDTHSGASATASLRVSMPARDPRRSAQHTQHQHNLMTQISSNKILDMAFAFAENKYLSRRINSCHMLWGCLTNWPAKRESLNQKLQQGTFILAPIKQLSFIKKESSQQVNYSVWEPDSEIVLKAVSIVLEKHLKSCEDLTAATHLAGHGGLKSAVQKNKTFIGKCSKGFYFLGYHIGGREDSSGAPTGISLAKQSFVRRTKKVYWLYEQQAGGANFASCLNRYVKYWSRWAKAGVGEVNLPTQIHVNVRFKDNVKPGFKFDIIFKLNKITSRPSQQSEIFLSNEICVV